MLKHYKMAKQRRVNRRDGTVISSGKKSTTKKSRRIGGKEKGEIKTILKIIVVNLPRKRERMPTLNLTIFEKAYLVHH